MPAQTDWQKELLTLLGRLSGSWKSPGEALEQSACDLIQQWIGGDNAELADVVVQALQAGAVTEADIEAVLCAVASAYASKCPLGESFAKALLANLRDGKLGSEEIAELAAAWVASRTSSPNLRALIEAAAAGELSKDEIEAAVLEWLRRRGATDLAATLEQALNSSRPLTVTMRPLALLLAAYLVQLRRITDVGTTKEKLRAAVVTALGNLEDSELMEILKAIADKRYPDAARLVLSALGITADEAVVQALLSGKLQPFLRERLTAKLKGAIKDVSDAQAAALAEEAIRLLKGEDKLVPEQTEQQALGMGDWEYGIWTRTRQVLYAAKLAAEGGAIVPTDPMARPHVFAAAAISADTVVKTLVDESRWDYFLEYIDLFSRAEFAPSINVPPIDREGMVVEEKTAFSVHLHIATQLT